MKLLEFGPFDLGPHESTDDIVRGCVLQLPPVIEGPGWASYGIWIDGRFFVRAESTDNEFPRVNWGDWGELPGAFRDYSVDPDEFNPTRLLGFIAGAVSGMDPNSLPFDDVSMFPKVRGFLGLRRAPKEPPLVSKMSIADVLEWQDQFFEHQRQLHLEATRLSLRGQIATGVGMYRFHNQLLTELAEIAKFPADALFDVPHQNALALLALKVCGLERYLKKEITAQVFGTRIATVWPSLPALETTKFKSNRTFEMNIPVGGSMFETQAPTVGDKSFLLTLENVRDDHRRYSS